MTFDRTVTIEPETERAFLWADTVAGARFRVVIDPRYAIDLWAFAVLSTLGSSLPQFASTWTRLTRLLWQPTPMAS
jgi:hypothetical protein